MKIFAAFNENVKPILFKAVRPTSPVLQGFPCWLQLLECVQSHSVRKLFSLLGSCRALGFRWVFWTQVSPHLDPHNASTQHGGPASSVSPLPHTHTRKSCCAIITYDTSHTPSTLALLKLLFICGCSSMKM